MAQQGPSVVAAGIDQTPVEDLLSTRMGQAQAQAQGSRNLPVLEEETAEESANVTTEDPTNVPDKSYAHEYRSTQNRYV
jgi:hypothetical protein